MSKEIEVRIMPNGRMVLPKAARLALGVNGAGVIAVSVEGDVVKRKRSTRRMSKTTNRAKIFCRPAGLKPRANRVKRGARGPGCFGSHRPATR
jgi:bifunctional DNA-binding transcriptional regulator/antitoxin component of YhaV-PrlF toxin-antitoxin module